MNQSVIFGIAGVVLLIVLLIVYYVYYVLPSKSNLAKYQIQLIEKETIIDDEFTKNIMMADMVPNRPTLAIPKLGYGISFSWEMYIPNLSGNDKWQNSFNLLKPLFFMNDSPQVGYHPKKNYLSIILKYRDNPFYAQFSEIRFEDIKLQKWTKYILVISGRNIQLWIDGKLEKTEYLPSLPVVYDIQSSLTIGQKKNNFNGKLRNFKLYPYPLEFFEISNV
jgi:hypothetical protein